MTHTIGRIPLDPNRREVLAALSSSDGQTVVPLEADAATGALLVKVVSGGGGGSDVQYVEGVTTSPATGTVALGRYQVSPSTLSDGQLNTPQLDVNGNQRVVGNVASGSTDSGAPVKVAGRYNLTKPSFTDGQRGDLQLGTRGSLAVTLYGVDSTTAISSATLVDATTITANLKVSAATTLYNGTTWDLGREVANATNSTGIGIAAVGILAQFDDVSPTSITENQFGNVRMSANRNLYGTIRDAAGNERGVNVTTANALTVDASATTQPVSISGTLPVNMTQLNGSATAVVATGVQAIGVSDGTNNANVVSGDVGFNGLAVSSADKTLSFTTSASGVQTILAATDTRGYSWIEIIYTSVGVGLALTGQYAPIVGGTYKNTSSFMIGDGGNSATSVLGVASATLYSGPTRGAFFQIAVSALTSGTFAGTVRLRAQAPTASSVMASQNGTWNITNVTGTVSLPTGAATVAKQPALGTAGSASTDVLTVQGITSMVPLKVDGSAVTQPVSTAPSAVNVGQKTVGTSAVQISASSTVPTNGILIGALSTNSASIFVGATGVTTSTGAELVPGGSLPFACNLNTLFIVSAASTSDVVWWNVT